MPYPKSNGEPTKVFSHLNAAEREVDSAGRRDVSDVSERTNGRGGGQMEVGEGEARQFAPIIFLD